MKLKREAHVLEVFWLDESHAIKGQIVGDDIDDMSIEMNGSFEENHNILGQTRVTDNGYTPNVSVESYHANPDDKIYPFLKDLALNRKSGLDAKCVFVEIVVDKKFVPDPETGVIPTEQWCETWAEYCYIEIVSYGGPAGNAMQINYTIHPCGKRVKGIGVVQYGDITMDGDVNVDDMMDELAKEKGFTINTSLS